MTQPAAETQSETEAPKASLVWSVAIPICIPSDIDEVTFVCADHPAWTGRMESIIFFHSHQSTNPSRRSTGLFQMGRITTMTTDYLSVYSNPHDVFSVGLSFQFRVPCPSSAGSDSASAAPTMPKVVITPGPCITLPDALVPPRQHVELLPPESFEQTFFMTVCASPWLRDRAANEKSEPRLHDFYINYPRLNFNKTESRKSEDQEDAA